MIPFSKPPAIYIDIIYSQIIHYCFALHSNDHDDHNED